MAAGSGAAGSKAVIWIGALGVAAAASAGIYYYADDIQTMFGNPPPAAQDVASAPTQDPGSAAVSTAAAPAKPAETRENPAATATESATDVAAQDGQGATTARDPATHGAASDDLSAAPETIAAPLVATDAPAPDASALAAPQIDLIRVEPDGATVIAGRAVPGSVVIVEIDGAEIDRLTTGADGKFAGFPDVGTSARLRVLTLIAELGGRRTEAPDQIILAPVVTADADAGTVPAPAAPSMGQAGQPPAADRTASAVAVAETVPQPAPAGATKTPGAGSSAADIPARPADVVSQTMPGNAPARPVADGDSARPEAEAVAGATPAPGQLAVQMQAAPEPKSEDTPAAIAAPVQVAVAEVIADRPASSTTVPSPGVADAPAQPLTAPDQGGRPSAGPGGGQAAAGQAAGIAVLRAGPNGVELLQTGAPARPRAMDRIELSTIGYTRQGDVLLSGRSRGAATIRVYLDNVAVADLPADAQGRWGGRLPGITPGVYTLRLDELDEAGKVTSRVETPFKREPPERLQQPGLDPSVSGGDLLARFVTVQKGDTLWAISRNRYGDGVLYVRVFGANREQIRDPDLIYPGQVFNLPD
ncbi:LysM peptidoglycan-binding domain-containing protein [Chachezhania sediminis]|uniref:LysM peptidoglycan-binding domain-containing protein n=1 Tax=Chachezhania sediminis TaxID=2599291 RepID=UPI00131C0927|nr:LysM peptidoglycan-binding domain-containing protein [Chachezhania sediminis]